MVCTPVHLSKNRCCTECAFLVHVSSVVFLLAGLLGSHGILRDCRQRRSGHACRLHDLDVLTGQTGHQLLTRGAACKEEVMGHPCQYGAEHRPDPVNLQVDKSEVCEFSW